jgi:hypothetical protein
MRLSPHVEVFPDDKGAICEDKFSFAFRRLAETHIDSPLAPFLGTGLLGNPLDCVVVFLVDDEQPVVPLWVYTRSARHIWPLFASVLSSAKRRRTAH